MSDIERIDFGFYVSSLVKNVDNCWVDAVRFGKGLLVHGTNSATYDEEGFAEIASIDGQVSNKYGVIFETGGAIGVQGQIQIGDDVGTNGTTFISKNENLIFLDRAVRPSFMGIYVYGNTTNKTTFQMGEAVGSGSSLQGVKGTTITAQGATVLPRFWVTGAGDFTSIKMYGCSISNFEQFKWGAGGADTNPTTAHFIDNQIFNLSVNMQRNMTPTSENIILRNRLITFANVQGLYIFDDEGWPASGYILVDTYGVASPVADPLNIYGYLHYSPLGDASLLGSGQVINFYDPIFSGTPSWNWVQTTGDIYEWRSYVVVVQKPDATKIQNARIYILDNWTANPGNENFAIETGDTDAQGQYSDYVTYRLWSDQATGGSPTETHGSWFERIVAFGYNFFEASIDFAGVSVDKVQSLTLDPEVDQTESYYDALTGIVVTEHGSTGLKLIGYDGGTSDFSVGDTVVGESSGAQGVVREIIGDTTSGELVLHTWNGTSFSDNENLQVSSVTYAQSNLLAGTGGYDLEYWWEVNAGGNNLDDVYGWLHTQICKATPSTWVTEMLMHRLYLVEASGGIYSTNDVDSEGVFISNRGTGTLTGMTDDSGSSYVPPTQVTLEVHVVDSATQADIENARVYLKADAGGPVPQGTVLINELSNVNGIASEPFTYSGDQPVIGWVRKASGSPYYKTSPLGGTITSSGYTAVAQMIEDE
jgi:hypothetical protein